MADKHGGKIGRYRLIAPIGSGGFATVYRAVDERLGCEVALKVLAENHSLVPDYRERFISEAQHLRRVDSYWVASIFDLGETDTGQPYMVLELADRGDLETRVNNLWDQSRSVSGDDLLVLAETLAHSLSAIHAADLVHRDVTPGNLLVRHNGLKPAPWSGRTLLDRGERLLLSDLGYAKDLRAASGITSGGGTAGFAAPEQHGEMTQVDTRADVYGATAVLEWAATGSVYEQPLTDVARIGMAEEPKDRFEDISAWHAAVRQVLTGPSSPVGISSGLIEDGPPPWARPALAAVAGLSLGFVVAAAFWYDNEPTSVNPNTTDAITETTDTTVPSTSTPPTLPPATGEESVPATPEGATEPAPSVGSTVSVPTSPTEE
ncbi:MAG: protein kinase [Acidimicrobiia bacterium]|nr:protein kinase [Acidimicrobiia bacterium]